MRKSFHSVAVIVSSTRGSRNDSSELRAVSELVDKLFAVHDSLKSAGLAHAFGGAIALAYCTQEPRGTRDLDVNIFTDSSNAAKALDALPKEVAARHSDTEMAVRDGQVRLWWNDTPVDIFLNNHPFHDVVAARVIWVPLSGGEIPVLDCASLVVFKALYNRTKDWADIEAIAEATPDQVDQARSTVADLIGKDDPIYARLNSVVAR